MRSIITKIGQAVYKQKLPFGLIIASFFISILFVNYNYAFYERPIVKVIEATIEDTTEMTHINGNKDALHRQQIIGEIKNGKNKGEVVSMENNYSTSGAYDQQYKIGDELFISIKNSDNHNATLTGTIEDVKRDKYVVIVAWVFVLTLLIVGKKQGLFSIVSLAINAAILSYALDIYVKNAQINLLFIAIISAVIFTIISLIIVNGLNEKTCAAISATLVGTFSSLLIAYLVIFATGENGLHYEEMQFLSRPYQPIFMAGLFLGSLGGVMDIAITMSSSIFGLYEKNSNISLKSLKSSGKEIGKDIMGTMTNILFFVYISGTIPSLILYLSNGAPLSFTLSMNISLEIARALAGGIGIVLAIPISLYTSIFFVKRKQVKV